MAAISLTVCTQTNFGDEVRLVGGSEVLGNWCPGRGLALRTSEVSYPWWTALLETAATFTSNVLNSGGIVEYKFVILGEDGTARWEPGPNRLLACHLEGATLVSRYGEVSAPTASIPQQLLPIAAPCRVIFWDVSCAWTLPGDELVIVGGCESLGGWDVRRGITLATSAAGFPKWQATSRMFLTGQEVPWKLLIRRADGRLDWEAGEDRKLPPPARCLPKEAAGGAEICMVRAEFNQGGFQVEGSAALPHLALEGAAAACPLIRKQPSSLSTCSTGLGDLDDGTASAFSGNGSCQELPSDSWETATPRGSSQSPAGPSLWAGAHRIGKEGGPCEDAYFIGPDALGVADGVGSMAHFARYGVDAAAYANELMELAAKALGPKGAAWLEAGETAGPDARAAAAVAAAEAGATTFGASTMAVLQLSGSSLGVANLGDSGFMVLRRGQRGIEVVARSTEQQHRWNFPYQLMRLPPMLRARLPAGTKLDDATDCDCYHLPARHGDLVLLFTDGLSDNLHEEEILEVVERSCSASPAPASQQPRAEGRLEQCRIDPEVVAQDLTRAAQARSFDLKAESPFAVGARQHGYEHRGGKEDDIVVVAAWVMP